jgi:MFS transporter, putative metabolite transport protein
MSADLNPPAASGAPAKTVQDYIDETPMWADATAVSYAPMTNMLYHSLFLTS